MAVTGIVSLNIYQGPEGKTHAYVCLDVDRSTHGPALPLTGGHSYEEFKPSLEGLKGCKIFCDAVSVTFKMGNIFPIAHISAEGHATQTKEVAWNTRVSFCLLTHEEAEQESFEIACQSERDGEYARYNACEQY